MRLSHLGQVGEEVCLELLSSALLQLLEHFAEVSVSEDEHVLRIVARHFLTFDSLGKQMSVELAHTPEARPFVQVLELLQRQLRVGIRVE